MHSSYNVEELLKGILVELGYEGIGDNKEQRFEIDSIDFVRLIVNIENTFNIEVPSEFLTFEKLNSFILLYEMIIEQLKND